MIYTITFNPSLDYIVSVNDFRLGCTNRTDSELLLPGGKGINVSMVLGNLGFASTALGFAAGFTGDELIRRLDSSGIHSDFIRLDAGMTRINLKLRSIDGTEINGQGPIIPDEKLQLLFNRLDLLNPGDVLFLSGSIPASLPDDIYWDIMKMLEGRRIRIVVDATGDLLLKSLSCHPFLIKPNHHELSEIFQVELNTREAVIPYAEKLREMGAQNVLVSLAGGGAVLAAQDGTVYAAPAPHGTVINSIGAGDSMLAGFVAGYLENQDYRHAFCMGLAAGSASAFSEHLAERKAVEALCQQIKSQL